MKKFLEQKKIIEELQVKVLSLEDRIDKLENQKIPELKNEKLEENISNKKILNNGYQKFFVI